MAAGATGRVGCSTGSKRGSAKAYRYQIEVMTEPGQLDELAPAEFERARSGALDLYPQCSTQRPFRPLHVHLRFSAQKLQEWLSERLKSPAGEEGMRWVGDVAALNAPVENRRIPACCLRGRDRSSGRRTSTCATAQRESALNFSAGEGSASRGDWQLGRRQLHRPGCRRQDVRALGMLDRPRKPAHAIKLLKRLHRVTHKSNKTSSFRKVRGGTSWARAAASRHAVNSRSTARFRGIRLLAPRTRWYCCCGSNR